MKTSCKIPVISAEEETPLVKALVVMIDRLLEANQRQANDIQQMRDEIAVLKGEKARPKFKSSKMDENTDEDADAGEAGYSEQKQRAGSARRSKTTALIIHEEKVISPVGVVPADAQFKGCRDVVVQGLVIKTHNIRYRLEC